MNLTPRLRRPVHQAGKRQVLLLHGMGGGVGGWDPLDALLSPELRLWDIALPWSTAGGVDWAYDADVARWVEAGIEATERAAGAPIDVVVAHSFAANVVLELANRTGARWRWPIVLISPFYRAGTAEFDWSVMNYYVDGFRTMIEDGLRLRAGNRIDEATRKDMAGRLCDLMGPYTWLRFFDTFLRTPLLRLDELTQPVLVIAGELDQGAQAGGARQLAESIPSATLRILDGCGHFPMAEHPETLAALINEFTSSLGPQRTKDRHHDRILERTS